MKTPFKKLLAIILALVSALVFALSMTACETTDSSSSDTGKKEEEKTFYTVTFESNGGSDVSAQQVEENACAEKPEDPTKEGFVFNGWYIDSALEESIYDFSTPVTQDITLYGAWADASSSLSAKFYLNDGTDSIFTTVYFEENKRVTQPANPVWEGHEFVGWYTDADCTTEFKFTKKYSENQLAYAKWKNIYTFEAEYSYIESDKWGQGYSGQNSGLGLIMAESENATENHSASNGYYVGWIYYNGATIDFTFTSDRDISDVKLVFRLTAEYQDCVVTGDQIYVDVNGTRHNFEFSITGVYGTEDMSKKGRNDFQNYTAATNVSIKKGENTISLVINNEVQGVGATMNALAPLVDCMYIYTSADLTLDLHTENVK